MSSQESGSSTLPLLNRHFKPPDDDAHSEASVAITSDEMSFTSEKLLSARLRRQNTGICITEAGSVLRHSYTEDLDSVAITSDDMSIANENPLTTRARRQNKPVPIAQAAAILRPSRAEELDESVAVTSDEEMSMTGHPHSLSHRPRRHDEHHPIAPAVDLLPDPPRGRRLLRGRAPRVSPQAPVPDPVPGPASRPGLASTPITSTTAMEVSPVDYGYGYGGHQPGNFFLTEDVDESEPDADPSLPKRQRFMYFNTFARQGDMDVVARQNAMLAGLEQSLELFPGVEGDTDSGFEEHGEDQSNEPKDEDGKEV
ncbi:hypothetical protein N7486_009162 [Penicillium sp. IBT 16267x]|nr:hypothetical protein N7486_009162 [Penicillium sp. IBT 16267x]